MPQSRRNQSDSATEATVHRRPVIRAVTAVLAIATTSGVAQAEVLYDTTDMTDNQVYDDNRGTVIGGAGALNLLVDVQVADDFFSVGTYNLSSVTGDYVTFFGDDPASSVLVELFADLGGTPSEVPFAATLSFSFASTAFTDTVFGPPWSGTRLTVDLSDAGITVGPGTWWISITPVNEDSPTGDHYQQIRDTSLLVGNGAHGRDGGIDHGTGYSGMLGVTDWTPWTALPQGPGAGDFAMKIEGTLVEPQCAWDCGDPNGTVGIVDFLAVLAQWGGPGSCDFDGGGVGITDFLALLANWGACP